MAKQAKIENLGNGFPSIGDYVQGGGQLYRVVSLGEILTGPDRIRAEVESADWSDCAEGDEFPGRVVLEPTASEIEREAIETEVRLALIDEASERAMGV